MKYLVKLGMIMCLGLAATVATANMASSQQATTLLKQSSSSSVNNAVSLLFVQQADQVTLTSVGNRCYDVLLSGLKTSVLYFSDQPQRVAGHMSNLAFISLWDQDKIVPNAVLHGLTQLGQINSGYDTVLTFSKPVYDDKAHTIHYQGCVTDAQQEPVITTKKLYDVSLFIDNFGPFGV